MIATEQCKKFRERLLLAKRSKEEFDIGFSSAKTVKSLEGLKVIARMIRNKLEIIMGDIDPETLKVLKKSFLAIDNLFNLLSTYRKEKTLTIDMFRTKLVLHHSLKLKGSQFWKKDSFPANILIKGDLEVEDLEFTLGSGVEIEGDLRIYDKNSSISEENIGNNLMVHGDIYVPQSLETLAYMLKEQGQIKGSVYKI